MAVYKTIRYESDWELDIPLPSLLFISLILIFSLQIVIICILEKGTHCIDWLFDDSLQACYTWLHVFNGGLLFFSCYLRPAYKGIQPIHIIVNTLSCKLNQRCQSISGNFAQMFLYKSIGTSAFSGNLQPFQDFMMIMMAVQ